MTKYDLKLPDGQADIQSDIVKRIRFESNPTELAAWTDTFINEYKNFSSNVSNKQSVSPMKKSKILVKKNTEKKKNCKTRINKK